MNETKENKLLKEKKFHKITHGFVMALLLVFYRSILKDAVNMELHKS